jgi:hypothetical protein
VQRAAVYVKHQITLAYGKAVYHALTFSVLLMRLFIGFSRSGVAVSTSACSQFWFATVQEVLHADWHEV